MALVETKPMSFADWRRRVGADGYAFAAGAALHGGPPERFRATEQARAVMWGGVMPALIALAAVAAGVGVQLFSLGGQPVVAALGVLAIGLFVYALKIAATAVGMGAFKPYSWIFGAASTLAHFYECGGVARYWFGQRKAAAPKAAG